MTNYLAHYFVKSQSTVQQKGAGPGRDNGGGGHGWGCGCAGRGGRKHDCCRGCGKSTVSTRKFNDDEWEQFSSEEQVQVASLPEDKKQKREAGISALYSV